MAKCGQRCEVYSRVCGYHRPVNHWNKGKKEEFQDRTTYKVKDSKEPLERAV
jgi:anaerobic ribonucleoside-triphosphate reductase